MPKTAIVTDRTNDSTIAAMDTCSRISASSQMNFLGPNIARMLGRSGQYLWGRSRTDLCHICIRQSLAQHELRVQLDKTGLLAILLGIR
jgi:hypothetical protein